MILTMVSTQTCTSELDPSLKSRKGGALVQLGAPLIQQLYNNFTLLLTLILLLLLSAGSSPYTTTLLYFLGYFNTYIYM